MSFARYHPNKCNV
ncbi:hypothetical protein VTO58DRAFT_108429 [Aureobasidium pullulans]